MSNLFSQVIQNAVDNLNPVQQIDNLCECRSPHTVSRHPSCTLASYALRVISCIYNLGCC